MMIGDNQNSFLHRVTFRFDPYQFWIQWYSMRC